MTLENKTFHILTFGCQMNVHDSDWLGRALTAHGWTRAPEDRARVVVVNTCSVREKPERKVYSLLGRLAGLGADVPGRFLAVGGCVAQQVGRGFFERFPQVRLVFGTDQTAREPRPWSLLRRRGRPLALLRFESEFCRGAASATPAHGTPRPGRGRAAEAHGQTWRPGSIRQHHAGLRNFCATASFPMCAAPEVAPGAEVLAESALPNAACAR